MTLPQSESAAPYTPALGYLGNLTGAQQSSLDRLRDELRRDAVDSKSGERMDDETLLRFLRARRFEVPAAKEMFVSCEAWRRSFGANDILATLDFAELPLVNRYCPRYFHKTDRDGRPIYIESFKTVDVDALNRVSSVERQLQRLVYQYERTLQTRLPACAARAGHAVDAFCTIIDLENLSLGQFYRGKDYLVRAASIGRHRYPGMMGKFYIINAPWAISAMSAFVKPLVHPDSAAKIVVLGTDYRQTLLEQIPAENLPKEYGGTCECGGGCTMSDAGPWRDSGHKVQLN